MFFLEMNKGFITKHELYVEGIFQTTVSSENNSDLPNHGRISRKYDK